MEKIINTNISKYTFKIINFEGPLDLLCHLIDKNQMDIYDININEITDQYISYLNEMENMNLEITSEFIIMASTLLYIKSKKLLPQIEEEDEITEEDLINKIVEYKAYKEISKTFASRYEEYHKQVFKMPEVVELPKQKLDREYENTLIPEVYEKIVKRNEIKINKNADNIKKIATNDNVTVLSKVKEIFKTLIKKSQFVFNKLFDVKKREKVEIVTAFMGLLELSRRNKVIISQEGLFDDIVVKKKRRV